MTLEKQHLNFVKEAMSAPTDVLMRDLGCIEILPEETGKLSKIRWSSYKVRTALRLGAGGSFIFDPKHELDSTTVNGIAVAGFEEKLRKLSHKQKGNLYELFPDVDPVLISGIEKRLGNDKKRRECLKETLKSPDKDQKLRIAFKVLQSLKTHNEFEKKDTGRPNVLILAHTNTPDATNIVRKVSNRFDLLGSSSIKKRLASVINTGLMMTMTPYLGAAIVGSEVESTGKAGKIEIMDFNEITEEKVEDKFKESKPQIAFVTGVLSIDIRNLKQTTATLQKKGIRTVVGGLAPTIDPNAAIITTSADVFIGEAEEAMDKVLDILKDAKDDERYIFHRESRNGKTGESIEIINDPDNDKIKHAYLGLDPLVNINEHYSRKNEESGQLASRLRFESMMQPQISAFGKKWEAPSWTFKQMGIKVGCPHGCPYCSTVSSQGTDMRNRPLDGVELEIMATETRSIIIVDQNLGAKDKKENIEEWTESFGNLLEIFKKHNKRVACQTELATWDRVNHDPKLRELCSKVIVAALGGIEQPRKIPGNPIKIPGNYPRQVGIMRELGIISVVTAIAGDIGKYPQSNSNSGQEITLSIWKKLLKAVSPDILVVFPLVKNPGSPGVPPTQKNADTTLDSYLSENMTNEDDWAKAFMIENLNPHAYLKTTTFLLLNNSPKRALVLALVGAAQSMAHNIKVHPIKLMREIR